MKIFSNNYDRIRQDNIDESVKLKSENQKKIERMGTYLSSHNVALFELEMMKKDLIGFAKEAEELGVPIEENLGMSQKDFCDSLLDGAMGKNFFDEILLSLRKIMLIVCGLTVSEFLYFGFPKEFGLLFSILFFVSIWTFLSDIVELKIRRRFVYPEDRKKKVVSYLITGIPLAVLLVAVPFLAKGRIYIFYGNGWAVVAAVLVVTLAVVLLNNLYWNLQSKKYKWK